MKYCKNCGAEMGDDDVYCMYCGTKSDGPIDTVDPSKIDPFAQDTATGSAQVNNQNEQPQSSAVAAKPVGIVEKAKAFESKHNIILNAVLIVCAIVVLFVSLFAPIKVVNYGSSSINEVDGNEITSYHAETSQSIFQIIGSVFYFKAGDKQQKELDKQYSEARKEQQEKYSEWNRKHPYASSQERANALVEIAAECLSEVNIFGYAFASTKTEDMKEGTFLTALVSAVIAILISVLSIATAILSLVYIIKAVLNIVHKKPQTQLFKYLSTVIGLSLSCIALMCCAPMLKAGGNMFAVALFTAIAYFVVASVGAIIGKVSVSVIIKRSLVAVTSIVAFFILCTNVIMMDNIRGTYVTTYYMPSGVGSYAIVKALGGRDGSDAAFMSAIVPFVMSVIIALFFVPYVGNVMHRSLMRIAYGNEKRSSVTALAIAAAVFAIITIAIGFASDTITNQIFELYDAPARTVTENWYVRAQVWVSMFLMIAVALLNRLYLPNDTVTPKQQQRSDDK